jgi:DNA-binding transcriptional regulator YiaG
VRQGQIEESRSGCVARHQAIQASAIGDRCAKSSTAHILRESKALPAVIDEGPCQHFACDLAGQILALLDVETIVNAGPNAALACLLGKRQKPLPNRAIVRIWKGTHVTIPFEKLKARLLANPKVKAEYEALAPEFEISAELVRARLRAGLSQAELAVRMGTSQSAIARLESGQTLPSTKTLLRYAEATGSKFHVRLSAA